MSKQFGKAALSVAIGALCATASLAQVPGGPPPGMGGPGMGGPGGPGGPGAAPAAAPATYTSILMQVDVNRPAADVWKRVGKFCDIAEWLAVPCTLTSGKDGEIGAVRSIGREILVGKTDLSYTYTQPATTGRPYDLYHGTLEAKPLTATTSRLYYTLMWDNSMCADDAAKERDKSQRLLMFQWALKNMKSLAEGGAVSANREGGPGGCAAPRAGGAGGMGGPGGPGGGAPGGPGGGAPRGFGGPGAPGAPGAPVAPGGALR